MQEPRTSAAALALQQMREALNLLDTSDEHLDAAAHLDLAVNRLEESLGIRTVNFPDAEVWASHGQPLSRRH